MTTILRHRSVFLFILAIPLSTHGSPGDYSPGYQRCVNYCNFKNCYTVDPDPHQLPFSLRLFHWTCTDDCSYQCMHDLTEKALRLPRAVPPAGETFEGWWDEPDWTPGIELEGLPPGRIVQFHGKWPFKRWYGVQEPLAVAFSLLNFFAYAGSYYVMQRQIPRRWALRRLYLGVAVVGMNAWIWSTLFHCRDKPWTERLDYFSAAAYALYGLYVSCVRIFRLYPTKALHHVPLPRRLHISSQLRLIMSAMFLAHIAFLSAGERFNYKYNMAVNVMVGVATVLLWLTWTASHSWTPSGSPPASPADDTTHKSLLSSRSLARILSSMATTTTTGIKPPYTHTPLIPLLCLIGAGSLELLDFPPIWNMSLDAHALWHLATFPLGYIWCVGVLARDAQWEARFVEEIHEDDRPVGEIEEEVEDDQSDRSESSSSRREQKKPSS